MCLRNEERRLGRIAAESPAGRSAADALARLEIDNVKDYRRIAGFVTELMDRLEAWEGEACRQLARAEGIDVAPGNPEKARPRDR